MSVSLSLNSVQSKVFMEVTKAAKISNIVYFSGNPELEADKFPLIVDTIQAAYFNSINDYLRLAPDADDDEAFERTDVLRIISDKLDKLWPFFPQKQEVNETIKAGLDEYTETDEEAPKWDYLDEIEEPVEAPVETTETKTTAKKKVK